MAEPMNKKQKLDYLVTEFAGLKRSVAKLLKRQEAMETTLAKIASGNSKSKVKKSATKPLPRSAAKKAQGLKRPVLVKLDRNVPDVSKTAQ